MEVTRIIPAGGEDAVLEGDSVDGDGLKNMGVILVLHQATLLLLNTLPFQFVRRGKTIQDPANLLVHSVTELSPKGK